MCSLLSLPPPTSHYFASELQPNFPAIFSSPHLQIAASPRSAWLSMTLIVEWRGTCITLPLSLSPRRHSAGGTGLRSGLHSQFFGFNDKLELQYRGRLGESWMEPARPGAKRELFEAMTLVSPRRGKDRAIRCPRWVAQSSGSDSSFAGELPVNYRQLIGKTDFSHFIP